MRSSDMEGLARVPPSGVRHSGVFVVTVTYGDRRALLEQMIVSTLSEGVEDIVIVNNGARWDVGELALSHPGVRFHIVPMEENTGSAAGFAAGMEAALAAGAEMLWLLDDDNRPRSGALSVLQNVYKNLVSKSTKEQLAVLAYRPEHQPLVPTEPGALSTHPRASAFLGFHLLDIPKKVWKRFGREEGSLTPLPKVLHLRSAPYSGLLLHRGAVEAMGMPRKDFVLYMDDTEWSSRLTQCGGRIALVTAARIEDLESSWNIKGKPHSRIMGLLCGEGDFRAYYSTRNAAYLSARDCGRSGLVYMANRNLYLLLLWTMALLRRRRARYVLLSRAVKDGEMGRMGIHPEYPL